jgi:hypothetical protein
MINRSFISSAAMLTLGCLAIPTAAQKKAAAALAPQDTGWVQTKKNDPERTNPLVQFTLTGKILTQTQKNASVPPPTISVTCHPKGSRGRFMSAHINLGTLLDVKYVEPQEIKGTSYDPKVDVRYRLDDGKEEKVQWNPTLDKNSVSLAKDDLRRLLASHSVQYTMNENPSGEISVQFDLPDSTQLQSVCELSPKK